MKKLLLILGLCMAASPSFYAQRSAVRTASAALNKNAIFEALDAIKPALTHEETKNEPDAWKIAGDIQYKIFKNEFTAEAQKNITNRGSDEEKMYTALYDMYRPYIMADSLSQIPDSKGKIKNKHRKDIAKKFEEVHLYYINAGGLFNGKGKYTLASRCFEILWTLPALDMFNEDPKKPLAVSDSIMQLTKFYSVATSIQANNNYQRSIDLLNKMIEEGYLENEAYKPADLYELLANEYLKMNDSTSYVRTIKTGADLFGDNLYFAPNLINEYIRASQPDSALLYIDRAINNDPSNACDLYTVKGVLYADKKNFEQSEAAYQGAIEADAGCQKALEGIGVLYMLKAQDIRDESEKESDKPKQLALDQQAYLLYQRALPYLEQYSTLLKSSSETADRDLRDALVRLLTAYYNITTLSKYQMDKSKEIEAIEKELEKFKDL